MPGQNPDDASGKPGRGRRRVSQQDVPAFSLPEVLRVADVLRDQYASQPTKPIDVAQALPMSPNSGTFRMLTGAAVAYGITDGGAQADLIALTDLGKRMVAPTVEGDDLRAKREALLRPRVIGQFLKQYDGSPLPSEVIAKNVLGEMGVPPDATDRTLKLIVSSAEQLGLLTEIKGKRYVRLDAQLSAPAPPVTDAEDPGELMVEDIGFAPINAEVEPEKVENNRVFVTHGSNREIVEQIKEILKFGKFDLVVSVEKESTAKPVSQKVLDDMRSCYAGIVHVGTERKLIDEEGKSYTALNENVLIEIGAAMALYRGRFVLLVEKGVELPSNLQGLYEVRYEGTRLDYEATMKLLKAFNEFRDQGA
jgi:hypothetical protein